MVRRLAEPRRFIQVLAGPRQVGKTTIVRQVLAELSARAVSSSADELTLRGSEWIAVQREAARLLAHGVSLLDGKLLAQQAAPPWPGEKNKNFAAGVTGRA